MKIRSEYKYIVFKITDDKKSIVIEHKGAKGADFAEFTSKLPDGDCRYSVLDVEINTKSGATANKLIFVAWCVRIATRNRRGGGARRTRQRWRARPALCLQPRTLRRPLGAASSRALLAVAAAGRAAGRGRGARSHPTASPRRRVPSPCASDARARLPTSCDRSDDNASIKPKMLYASSKDALKKTLSGINEEYQATDRGDLDLDEIKKKAGNV